MRLHSLSVTAFGPFPATVSVDLDDLARDGLFLLWGPTGAGKTTLLDAVVFALYGTVPGVRGHEKRLRSDHADAGTRTEVTCELTVSGERLRVVRRPEQARPKKRGDGWTSEPARLSVARWRGRAWEPVSTRIDEGTEHLATRIGLTAEQFCQVVLLPQGDFARFLRCEPEDRARLLGTLFDVGRFARAEEWLAAERRAADEALRREQVRLGTLLARVAQTAAVHVPEELAPELVGAAGGRRAEGWVGEVRAGARASLLGATVAADDARARSATAEAALAVGRALGDRHDRREKARAEVDRLLAEEPELAPLRERVDVGRRAESLRDVLAVATRTEHAAAETADREAAARAAWAPVAAGRKPVEATARALRDAAGEVRALLPDVQRAAELDRDIGRLGTAAMERTRRCVVLEAELTALPERITRDQEAVDRAREAAARLPGLGVAADAAANALDAARRADRLEEVLSEVSAAAARAREQWVAERERLVDVRARRLDGMAAELAASLHDGLPCPVCGGTEHPQPAEPAGPAVSGEDEERARARADAAGEASVEAARAAEDVARELQELRGRAGDGDVAELAMRAAATRADHAEATGLAAGLTAVTQRLVASVAEREEAAAELAAAGSAAARADTEASALRDRLAELQDRLDRARGDDADLRSRLARLGEEADRCEAVLATVAEELRARADAEEARAHAGRRAADQGFEDLAAASAALLDPGELARTEQRLHEHDWALAVQERTVTDPDLVDLAPRSDLDALGAVAAEAAAAREAAVVDVEQIRRCTTALDELAAEVVAADVALADRRALADQVGSLADLVGGRGANTLRMRLQSFVLAARLEQVASAASRRLRDMSGGRYTFLHSDAQARHGARSGLGLDVLDEYTGTRRPTKTLSGGESFMASLALALGLADVVSAESGGIRVDTLFVDEGFGTLDADSLDAVMGVLDELRRGGRTVGVISHVEEVRTRIPARLEVIPGRRGSRLAG